MGSNGAAEEGGATGGPAGAVAGGRARPAPPEPEQAIALPELDRLEQAVRRLLASGAGWRAKAEAAEQRGRELQEALDAVRTGTLDPRQLGQRVAALEAENEALRQRLRSAEAIAQRIHARLQLLEEER